MPYLQRPGRSSRARAVTIAVFALSMGLGFSGKLACAYSEYQTEFRSLYTRGPSVDRTLRKVVMRAKCYVCHCDSSVKESDKPCNPFGKAIARHAGKIDKKEKRKIIDAIEKAVLDPVDSEDSDGPTFGDLLNEGRLPGGDLETIKNSR